MAAVGGAALVGSPAGAWAGMEPPAAGPVRDVSGHSDDWRWLLGTWNVHHSRLKERLAGDTRWEEFAGKSAMWLTLDGLGTIDDNLLELPGGTYRGLSIRAFDPVSGTWAIWWLDGRNSTRIDPPVRGGFEGTPAPFSAATRSKDSPSWSVSAGATSTVRGRGGNRRSRPMTAPAGR